MTSHYHYGECTLETCPQDGHCESQGTQFKDCGGSSYGQKLCIHLSNLDPSSAIGVRDVGSRVLVWAEQERVTIRLAVSMDPQIEPLTLRAGASESVVLDELERAIGTCTDVVIMPESLQARFNSLTINMRALPDEASFSAQLDEFAQHINATAPAG